MADNEKVQKQLEKKARKFFREKRKEYSRLGSKGALKELATKLPLDDYEEFVKNFTYDEFYEFFSIFQNKKRVTELMALTDIRYWFNKCCCDMRLIDELSDEHFTEILNNEDIGSNDIERMFNSYGQNMERRLKIVSLVHKEKLEGSISICASVNALSNFNGFLEFLYGKETHSEISSERAKATGIFTKIANFSGPLVARLLVENSRHLAKRILQEVRNLNRNERSIYALIPEENLYDVLEKTDFEFLNNEERYTWVYENIAKEDEEDFFVYLVDKKNSDMELFNPTICAEVYSWLHHSVKEEFLKELFIKKSEEEFCEFYENIEDKVEMFEILSKDEEGRKIIDFLLLSKSEEELTFLEKLVKEKYVTKK